MIAIAREQTSADATRSTPRVVGAWRVYALLSLIPLVVFADILAGPGSQRPFAPLKGVDFGAFYSGAMLVREGRSAQLGNMDAQRAAQKRIQQREHTGWNWYNALPHPPVASIAIAPLAWLSLRTAFWVFAALGLAAAGGACWILARAFAPAAPFAVALVLVAFEPIWDVAWWGQIDNLLLLPVALGTALLGRGRDRGHDLAAGALLGAIALKPIFVPIPFLVLLWGRRRAAVGMALTGGALAAASVAAVGVQGVRDYVHLSRYYERFTGSPMIVEWRMYNLRGMAIRLHIGTSGGERLAIVLGLSLLLGVATVVIAGRALARDSAPDLALGVVMLGTLLTAYHVHVQSLVLLTIPLAVWIGRSLSAATPLKAALWATPVVAIHAGAALLRPDKPSPSPSQAGLETYLTACCLVLLLVQALWLAMPRPVALRADRRAGA